jgi:serine/threonine-protein kinase HipA
MTERRVFVYVDLAGRPVLAGRLWARAAKGKEGASFEYDAEWARRADHFALEPALTVGMGARSTPATKALFGAIGDSAPDRWGRNLMNRAEARAARREKRQPRALLEVDYLLGVNDVARQGAMRFALEPGGEFLASTDGAGIPPLVDLPRLLRAAEDVLEDRDTNDDLQVLLAPGSSLGGARPKASVREPDGRLAIAKFPKPGDEYDVVRAEALALALARNAGIHTCAARVERANRKPVLIVDRFDRRAGARRIPFLSAMSMLGATDGETRSYMELADALLQHGAAPAEDRRELWRRIVFTVLVSNTDDHLRNHGFLHDGTAGWRLSPCYDVNPMPTSIRPRVLSTAINEADTTASIETALEVSEYCGVDSKAARSLARSVADVTSRWRSHAKRLSITARDMDRLESAFEHDDLRTALKL